jgi:taurine dioxygenase
MNAEPSATENEAPAGPFHAYDTTGGMVVRPVAGALGAEIAGVDLAAPLADVTVTALRRALAEHMVVFFRDQRLDPVSLVALTRRLGAICRVPYIEHMADHPDVIAVLKEADERGISTFGGTWHSDFSFLEAPPMATVLYAVEVPPVGGDTLWASMVAAYETLSPAMRAMLDPLRVIHSGAPHGTRNAPAPHLRLSRSIRMVRDDPGADVEVAHPLVRVHPETGRRALFLNPVYTLRIDGMTVEESRPLLGFLQDHATRPELTCRFRWLPGSLAIWDNRSTQHLAINDYDGHRRLMYRTTVAGERPIGAA